MRILTSLLILCAVAGLCGCDKLRYGNVIEKKHTPAYESVMMMPLIISTGKSTIVVMVPYFIHHTESWSIDVRGLGNSGDTITRTFYVNQSGYDTMDIGKFICVDGMCKEDTGLHKTRIN